jgi:Rrf2 family protein
MALNCRFAMAVHVLARLATAGECVSSAELAENYGTNAVVVRRLLADLQRAGLVENIKGTRGGSALAKPAEKITLDEIYHAVDDTDVFLVPKPNNPRCPIASKANKTLSEVLDRVESALERELKRTRLSDVIPS